MLCFAKSGSHFILSGLNYYVNESFDTMHLLCVFTLYLYFKKYLHVITSVIDFCNYIYNYTVDPSLTP